jgi:carboxypeptidase C (cathepsin A)
LQFEIAEGSFAAMHKTSCIFLVFLLSATLLRGAEEPAKPSEKPADKAADVSKKKEGDSEEKKIETKHTVSLDGQKIDYTVKAGTILLRDRENKPTAEIFYIAYTKDNVGDLSQRPITFSFNGGPGSSSVWLHMGLLGPRRVKLQDDGSPLPPPYKLVDNEFSLIDETDLVFIDPVSTGYSRSSKPDDAKRFHGVEEDIRSVAEFIRLYTTRHTRWASPKFIIGESYGTTRAAGLSGELRERHRMNVNGIMLVSTVLNFQTIRFAAGNDLPYVLYLPTYTATAWHHKKLPPDLQQLPLPEVLRQAEVFASTEFNNALLQGAALPPEHRQEIAKQLARFTGLSQTYLDRSDLRVNIGRFAEELLREEGRVVGRYDSRYKGYVRDRVANNMEYDPSGEAIYSLFTSTFNHYVRTELKFESDLFYEILNGGVNPWNWGTGNSYVNVAETLADSLTRNPFLKVHVSNGYYDLATPYFATRYTFNHLDIDPALAKNVTIDDYTAGHMMYLNLPDLKKQKADLAKFIRSACSK